MEGSLAPIWIPDAEAPECSLCKVPFGLITRRHHCRACGGVFCHQCCSQRLRLPDHGIQVLARVCLRCFKEHSLEEVWEAESFTARYYLRLHAGYSLATPLFEASRRDAREKSMFVVHDPQGREYMLSLLARGPGCVVPYPTSDSARGAFQRVLLGIRHPFVWPITEAAYMEDRDRAVLLYPLAKKGSLRDVMHKANPKAVFGEKYGKQTVAPLPAHDIALYARQILEALLYLTSRRFRVSHLHSGNILVEKKCCHLIGLENELLGMSFELEEKAAAASEDREVLAFGRVLFEMAVGQRLRGTQLPRLHDRTCVPPFHHILRQIFAPPSGRPPTLEELVQQRVFAEVELVADVRFIHQTPLDAKGARLLEQVHAASTGAAAATAAASATAAATEGLSDGSRWNGASEGRGDSSTATGASRPSPSQSSKERRRPRPRRRESHNSLSRDRDESSLVDGSRNHRPPSGPSSPEQQPPLLGPSSTNNGASSTPCPSRPSPPPPPPKNPVPSPPSASGSGAQNGTRENGTSADTGSHPRGAAGATPALTDGREALLAAIRNPAGRKLRRTGGAAKW